MPKREIVVAGDTSLNWLIHSASAGDPGGRATVQVREGGALLLSRLVATALEAAGTAARVASYEAGELRALGPDRIAHSYSRVERFQDGDNGNTASVIRVAGLYGSSDPSITPAMTIADEPPEPEVVVVQDSGGTFRRNREAWPIALKEGNGKPVVVAQLGRGMRDNPLIEQLTSHFSQMVAVVDADDLRADGVSISRGLSWERTARELVWQLEHNQEIHAIRGFPNTIVRFGLEGATHCSFIDGAASARLLYDPLLPEGGFPDTCRGRMIGCAEAFTASLVARIVSEGLPGIVEGARDGIRNARRFASAGFGSDSSGFDFPDLRVFHPAGPGDALIADARIPISSARDSADPDFWCLLNELDGRGLEPLAHRVVVGDDRGLRGVPVGRFGALRSVDRSEIESLSSIRSLIGQYLGRRETRRPLCLAVFGPPGSGKSFGVEQVAKSIAGNAGIRVEKLEFNLSQFESTRSLVTALHRVRDEVVKGRIPLVFFDEFDSFFGSPLGWLRYFLAPMQDGVFQDGDAMHAVGKSIFVFAGGLSDTFAKFSRAADASGQGEAEMADELRRFREAKGPDFVSRLRGYVDVKGLNPDPARPDDRLFLLRRAMIARSMLERNWGGLRSTQKPHALNIEESVVRALIGVPVYRHGARSLEAVLEMSMLDGKSEFDPAALPAAEQLEQHVDSKAFGRLVLQGVLFAAAREAIAEAVHERYRDGRAGDKDAGSAARHHWETLPENYRSSNRGQAGDVIRKLERINCGYRPSNGSRASSFTMSEAEIETLAELEHDRWMTEKLEAGYSFGPDRDDVRRTHPDLVAWNRLPEQSRQYDRKAVAAIPALMQDAGFELYRL